MNNKSLPTHNDFLNVVLAEYSNLRSELRDYISKQFTILSGTFTIIATLFTFGVKLMSSEIPPTDRPLSLLFYVIIPCFCMFSGIIWLDCVYRQTRLGIYLSILEKKVNKKFVTDEHLNDIKECPMYWEHYADSDAHCNFLFKVNHWNYYFSLMLYITLPILSMLYLQYVEHGTWYSWCYITPFVMLCFIGFLLGYIAKINQQIKLINNVSLFADKTR